MPAHFQATYTPIAAAGTEHQISHVSRLLATQLTMAGMGKGIAEIQRQVLFAFLLEARRCFTYAGAVLAKRKSFSWFCF